MHVKDSGITHPLESQEVLGGGAEKVPVLLNSPVNTLKEASLLASDPCGFLQVQTVIHGSRSSVRADHHLTNSTCSIKKGRADACASEVDLSQL